jgi:hypothetical protein
MRSFLRRAAQPVRRLRFTILMLVLFGLAAIVTRTWVGDLSQQWLRRLGFAPRDLNWLGWPRLFTSALVTDGGFAFWGASTVFALGVGTAEWLTGTRRTALTFWGVHLLTLVVGSVLIAWPLHWLGFTLGRALVVARDVGPSAGYFGCIGLACSQLGRWRWGIGALIMLGLLAAAVWPLPPARWAAAIALGSNLAHLMAFPLGWLASRPGRR